MKHKILFLSAIAASVMLGACSDDEMGPGNPQMEVVTLDADAFYGDSLPFTINAKDIDVPLSTLKAQLFFGEEMVSETVIRTKVSGQDYSGKIYVPYLKNTPNGTATLKYVLQNINMTITEMSQDLVLARPEWSTINLVAEDGTVYPMNRVAGTYDYVANADFGGKVNAKIVLPAYGENGNEMSFGWNGSAVEMGASMDIPFSASTSQFDATFNTLTYEASPFVEILFGGRTMSMTGNAEEYVVDATFTQGEVITVEGLDINGWYIDPAYLKDNGDGTFTWLPITGSYKVTAKGSMDYFQFEVLTDGELATLADDGSGALWIIGDGIGKPSVGANQVGWTTEKGLCMAPIAPKVYSVVVTAGVQVKADAINFKFFGQKDWGIELKGSSTITSTSDLVLVGNGDGHDDGNLYLADGAALEVGHIYRFTVDCTAGSSAAVLSVEDIGTEELESATISINGVELEQLDLDNYQAILPLTQGQTITATGIGADFYLDPDYISSELKFLAVDGDYRVRVNTAGKYVSVTRMNGTEEATLGDDGHGAIWLMGWGVGSPSLDNQFGWTPGAAYAVAEIAPKVYQFTGAAGPEVGSSIGQRFRFDYLSFKFFHQDGWGGEFAGDTALSIIEGAEYITDNGNFELTSGAQLEEGVTYVVTIDLSAGNNAGTISFKKK